MVKYKIIIIHGTKADPGSNWIPWLKEKLKKLNTDVFTPRFPTPKNQTINNWIKILDKVVVNYDKSVILIGHSSAPLVICAKLQKLDKPIKAAFFIAPFLGNCGITDYDKANRDFNFYPFNWELIKRNANKFYIYRSDNDPYVNQKIGSILAINLKVEEKIIPKGGHLNAESGFVEFPLLLEDIEKELEN